MFVAGGRLIAAVGYAQMHKLLARLLADTEGAETAEWVLIAALIVTVAVALYSGALQDALSGIVNGSMSRFTGT